MHPLGAVFTMSPSSYHCTGDDMLRLISSMASLSIDDVAPLTGTDSTPADWDTLPAEVIDNVLDHLTVDDLKTCRLVNKRTSSLATPGVFREVHLSLNMRSVKNLENIVNHSQLGGHLVHRLVWHRYGLMDMAKKLAKPVWSQEHKLLQASDPDRKSVRILQLRKAYGKELMDQDAFKEYDAYQFEQLLSRLKCLKALIYICDIERTSPLHWPLFPEDHPLVQRTGLRNAAQTRRLDLVTEWPMLGDLTRSGYVELARLGWQECIMISRTPRWHFRDFFRRANHVKITFDANEFSELRRRDSTWILDPCDLLKKFTKNLTSTVKLSLGFDEIRTGSNRLWHEEDPVAVTITYMTHKLLTSHFRNVRELTLTNIITDELVWSEFVRRHEPTLVSLTVQKVRLRHKSGKNFVASVSKKRVMQLLKDQTEFPRVEDLDEDTIFASKGN